MRSATPAEPVEERSFGRGDPVRDYWVAHAEGFRLVDPTGPVGVVEDVEGNPARPEEVTLRVRRGSIRGSAEIAGDDVQEVVPAQRLLLLGGEYDAADASPRRADAVRPERLGSAFRAGLVRALAAVAAVAGAVVAFLASAKASLTRRLEARAERREPSAAERARRRRERAKARAAARGRATPARGDPFEHEGVEPPPSATDRTRGRR